MPMTYWSGRLVEGSALASLAGAAKYQGDSPIHPWNICFAETDGRHIRKSVRTVRAIRTETDPNYWRTLVA